MMATAQPPRTLRQKMAAMAERGTQHEAAIAREWLSEHPVAILNAEEILAVDDSEFGPSEAQVEAEYQAYLKRSRNG